MKTARFPSCFEASDIIALFLLYQVCGHEPEAIMAANPEFGYRGRRGVLMRDLNYVADALGIKLREPKQKRGKTR